MAALAKGAKVRTIVTAAFLMGSPLLIFIVAAIDAIKIYVLFIWAAYFIAGIVAVYLSIRYFNKQQWVASRLASQHLGLRKGLYIPARVIRYGPDPIDAWLIANGVRNPVTGLDPRVLQANQAGDASDKFRDPKAPVTFGLVVMFVGFALLIPWVVLILRASITATAPYPGTGLLAVGAFAIMAVGIVLIAVFSRRRVRARIAWAKARQSRAPD